MVDAPVHPGDAPAVLLPPEPVETTPAMAPSITTVSPPPVASTDRAACYSTIGTKCRRMLQEAVNRRLGGLPWAKPPCSCPSVRTLQPEPLSSSQTECLLPSPGSSHTSPPCPLIPPTTSIIGDSITRDICFINAFTCCFPGTIVPVILDKLLNLLPSLATSIT
eukprot:superscaffoldBa00000645_g6268